MNLLWEGEKKEAEGDKGLSTICPRDSLTIFPLPLLSPNIIYEGTYLIPEKRCRPVGPNHMDAFQGHSY